ncbi:MlaD family protein [Henriciella litoralis]|uniref:MlaD family protein n=1 Tax=Henriciella litoralis TaxID=568102 RepID=UPI0009FC68BA|nr:MlaD family protein [Henriciella litoralis]
METRANYALIGAFVIVAALTALGFVLWLGQAQFNQDFDRYDIVFDGPVSLEEGASVRYIGIKVGEVESIGIDRSDASKVRARIRVDSETPVKVDSTASIEFAGITGVTFVQINAGSDNARRLTDVSKEDIPEIKSVSNPLGELVSSGTEVMGRATLALERIEDLLSEENVEGVSNIISNFESLSALASGQGKMATTVIETLESVDVAAKSFDQASRDFSELSSNVNGELAGLSGQASDIMTEIQGVATSANSAIERAEQAIDSAATVIEGPATDAVTDFRLIAQDLRVLIARLDRLSREIEQNPQSLIRAAPLPYEGGRE